MTLHFHPLPNANKKQLSKLKAKVVADLEAIKIAREPSKREKRRRRNKD